MEARNNPTQVNNTPPTQEPNEEHKRTKENERRALVPHLPFHLPLVFCNLHSSSSSLCFVQIQAERNVARDLNKEQSEEE